MRSLPVCVFEKTKNENKNEISFSKKDLHSAT